MEGERLSSVPDSLFNLSIATIVACPSIYNRCRKDKKFETLPPNLLFGILYGLYTRRERGVLYKELQDLEMFSVVLQVTEKRTKLYFMFKYVMDKNMQIIKTLTKTFREEITKWHLCEPTLLKNRLKRGLNIGGFYSVAGWFADSKQVYKACLDVSLKKHCLHYALECCLRLCHVQILNYQYAAAKTTCRKAFWLVARLKQQGRIANCALLYAEKSTLLCALSRYSEAFTACSNAMQRLISSLPVWATISVLTQCAEVYVVKGKFKTAMELVKLAVYKAKEEFGSEHPKYANVLLVYGNVLYKKSALDSAMCVYNQALSIYLNAFGDLNIHAAFTHKYLAKATFAIGRRKESIEHSKKAARILQHILPQEHPFKIFIIKNIHAKMQLVVAVNERNISNRHPLLSEVLNLNFELYTVVQDGFGDCSMHMANHYLERGLLFKIINEYEKAEISYKKAINIMTTLLGPDHYEVADLERSLASLYNYDMRKYDEAERLYKHAIHITKRVIGKAFLCLRYDYTGLQHLYHVKGADLLAQQYRDALNNWKLLRVQNDNTQVDPFIFNIDSLENIISKLPLS